MAVPQPIPYQGSKRQLAPAILAWLPAQIDTLREPFAGSGALTLAAADRGLAARYALGDTLRPLVALWSLILHDPDALVAGYAQLWTPQPSRERYEQIRSAFNQDNDPVKLLFLATRCVKNAIRFNREGAFNQSADRRRAGTRPERVAERVSAAHHLLAHKTTAAVEDYAHALQIAGPDDVVFLDPPYLGVSGSRDPRYHQGLDLDRFVAELAQANARGVAWLVTLDGRCGDRVYGPGLPDHLGAARVELAAGRSSQSTLSGRAEQTVESLYLSPALLARRG